MAGRYWFCMVCREWHPHKQSCPKVLVGAADGRAGAPAILGRTSDATLRPDEQNIVKEMKLSVQAEEAAGKLTSKQKEYWGRHIDRLERKHGDGSTFLKHTEIPFGIPRDLQKRVRVGYGKR